MALLKAQGVNKIIALGHSGIDVDISLAKNIPDLDIIIGGHTNTFLYTGACVFYLMLLRIGYVCFGM